MYFDRFDICEAYYLAFSHCHGGQRSREYARMCAMARYFRPSPMLSVDSLSDNGREIYERVCADILDLREYRQAEDRANRALYADNYAGF